ncbi:MAG: FAD/NAD(P)-binding oxidoreductase [Candidatus Zixiibacteriota bacterium]
MFKENLLSRRGFIAWGAGALVALANSRVLGETMSSRSTTLILGGGFGGIAAARHLRRILPDRHEITLVSKSRTFQVGATKTWVMLGEVDPAAVAHPLDTLGAHGIKVVYSEVEGIDLENMQVKTTDGALKSDFLVIALGAELTLASVPGLGSAAETFYTRGGAIRLQETLRRFDGGRIILLIPRIPFQCPPGPYEAIMLLHSHLGDRGLRAKSPLDVFTVEKAPMATAGPEIGRYIVERLKERNIGFHPQCQVDRVDGEKKEVVMSDGSRVAYDLLIAIPPHVAPRAVRDSGLTNQAGWIQVNPGTLEVAESPVPGRVFAVGDVTSLPLPGRFVPDMPLVLPKAGIFAERQGAVVARQIASRLNGNEPVEKFDGTGFCYIELGGGLAMRGDGNFFQMPHPSMSPREPSAAQLTDKKAWINDWISTYL